MPYIVLSSSAAAAAPALTAGAPRTGYGKTLGSMRQELKKQLINRTEIEDGRLDDWINDAYVDLCASLTLPQLYASFAVNTADGQAMYRLPDQVEFTRGVAVVDESTYPISGGRPLEKIDLDTYRRMRALTGEPELYFREGDILVLWPTPKAGRTLAVDARIQPLDLVQDTDSPILPRAWHEIILKGARAKALSALLEFQLAQEAENEYIALIRRKQDPIAEEDSGRLVGSSVPRNRRDLIRLRRGYDAL